MAPLWILMKITLWIDLLFIYLIYLNIPISCRSRAWLLPGEQATRQHHRLFANLRKMTHFRADIKIGYSTSKQFNDQNHQPQQHPIFHPLTSHKTVSIEIN
jgi:hypothetical protein